MRNPSSRWTWNFMVGSCLGLLAGCAGPQARLFDGLGDHHRPASARSGAAQKYFDQGLVWAYAFNHDEAIRSFREAARLDPQFAMAWWGVALCNGPHINNPTLPPERARDAYDALQKAVALRAGATPVEQALIDALRARYDGSPATQPGPRDRAYADAMSAVWAAYPDDADVGTLYAEALMNLRPWDLWQPDGAPQPGTQELLEVLERVLAIAPNHPGANHLYIHAVESSPDPARGKAAADRLRRSVPASGHLTHMPSHIDVVTGSWAAASDQNELAIEADRAYRALAPRQGFYHVYMLHNHHMLAFAAMMEGRHERALAAARHVVQSVPATFQRENAALVDPYMGAVYDVHKRFGRWDDMLREPPPPKYLLITTAMWRFNRGLAYAAKGDLAAAEREREAFRQAVAAVPQDRVMAINAAHDVLKVAESMLAGEIALARGDAAGSIEHLRAAVAQEDKLKYMEPPEWVQPARHTLGAVLLRQGRAGEAAAVYREDLKKWPNNGWSLFGLRESLRAAGRTQEAAALDEPFAKAWSRADTKIGTSCLCVPAGP